MKVGRSCPFLVEVSLPPRQDLYPSLQLYSSTALFRGPLSLTVYTVLKALTIYSLLNHHLTTEGWVVKSPSGLDTQDKGW